MLFRAFRRNDHGATAIEFAFVAPMVIVLIIATLEIGILEVMSGNLDAAVMTAARKIRTGAADRPVTSAALADMICANMIDDSTSCHSRLATSVQTAATFAGAPSIANATPTGQFYVSQAGDIVLIRASYTWPLILPMYAGNFQLAGPTSAQLDTRAAFRNEPYE